MFSTTFLWLETLMPVTNAIGAAYTVAWNVAVQVCDLDFFSYSYFFHFKGKPLIQIYGTKYKDILCQPKTMTPS